MSARLRTVLIVAASLLISAALAFAITGAWPGSEKSTDSAVTQPAGQASVKLAADEKRVLLSELGLVCISCRAAVGSALDKVDGVKSYSIDVEQDWAVVIYKTGQTSPKTIKEAIVNGGYKVGGVRELD